MKTILLITLGICIFATARADFFKNLSDGAIYKAIEGVLTAKYPDDPKKVECMVKYMEETKIADKFYSADLLTNPQKLSKELEPHMDVSEAACSAYSFFYTPLGIVVLIIAVIVLLGLIGVFGWCCCCRR